MQLRSRLYIRFAKKENWETFLKDFKFNSEGGEQHCLYEFIKDPMVSYEFFGEGVRISEERFDCEIGDYWDDSTIESMADALITRYKEDAIILADSINYSVGPEYSYEVYCVGGNKRENPRLSGAVRHANIEISDIKAWIGSSKIKDFTDEEKKFLKLFQ